MQHHQVSIGQLLIQVNNMYIFINLIKNIHVEKSVIKPIRDIFLCKKYFTMMQMMTQIEQYNYRGNKQNVQCVKNNQLTSWLMLPLSLLFSRFLLFLCNTTFTKTQLIMIARALIMRLYRRPYGTSNINSKRHALHYIRNKREDQTKLQSELRLAN